MNRVESITNQLRKIHYAYILVLTLSTHKYETQYSAIEIIMYANTGNVLNPSSFQLPTHKPTCKYIARNFSQRF